MHPLTNPHGFRFKAIVVVGLLTLQFGHTSVFAEDLKEPRFMLTWGQKGEKPGEFHSPIGIVVNGQDQIFVTDLNNARVQKFDSAGKYLGGFDLPQDVPPRKQCILGGIALDRKGLIYLSFMVQNKIAVYTEAGKPVREWGKHGSGDGEFNQPGGLLIQPDGTLDVVDQCNHRVQKFTPDGKFLGKWGEHGAQPGQFGGPEAAGSRFAGPHFLARDSKGRLYTTEAVLGRVQQLTGEGKPLLAWGDKGTQPGGFGSYSFGELKNTFGPIGVMVDQHDRVWVSSLNDRVQAFTPEGKYLFGISLSGNEPGEFSKPHGMAFDSHGFLYVADAGNQRIQKFEVPPPTPVSKTQP
tara:strand:+ start:2999 stop:4051 length:1053 start_codon:yes stop_codon:yes gene_type:complete